jgi:hypothetical protein
LIFFFRGGDLPWMEAELHDSQLPYLPA